MLCQITVKPGDIKKETRLQFATPDQRVFTGAYIGEGTYCWDLNLDVGIEFQNLEQGFTGNFQVGKYVSIAEGLSVTIGRTHNIKCVHSGALSLLLKQREREPALKDSTFIQKGTVVIQNDVYIGEGVKIMPNVLIGNGAVIAANSHVVSNIPPYAVAGGNPAKVIGYRFSRDIIQMLQIIRWWDWGEEKLVGNASFFTEDVEGFCDRFFDEENRLFLARYGSRVLTGEDVYFAFVDFYENYCNYVYILQSFLDAYAGDERKRLILFVQSDTENQISEQSLRDLYEIAGQIEDTPAIRCKVSLEYGDNAAAEKVFAQCQHYLISRTYRAVHFSCLADLLGIETLSGVDQKLLFHKERNTVRV